MAEYAGAKRMKGAEPPNERTTDRPTKRTNIKRYTFVNHKPFSIWLIFILPGEPVRWATDRLLRQRTKFQLMNLQIHEISQMAQRFRMRMAKGEWRERKKAHEMNKKRALFIGNKKTIHRTGTTWKGPHFKNWPIVFLVVWNITEKCKWHKAIHSHSQGQRQRQKHTATQPHQHKTNSMKKVNYLNFHLIKH